MSVFDDIRAERQRQENLKLSGKLTFSCADVGMTHQDRLPVLIEEVGEVARHMLGVQGFDTGTLADMREELVQVAAVAVAWIEGIDAEVAAT